MVARANKSACAHCGVEFGRSRTATARAKNNFCSWACRKAFYRVARTCKACGSGFTVSRGVLSGKTNASANFCCRPCYEKWMCRTDRVTGRGSQWAKARAEALRRMPFCGWCGTRHGLQVHHIAPFRLSRDNQQTNLMPLCVKHHKVVECVTNEVESIGTAPDDITLVMGIILRSRAAATAAVLRRIASAAR